MTDQAQQTCFLVALTDLGGSAGNVRLREVLSWDEPTYDEVKQELLANGTILSGRGRGGSVSISATTNAPPAAPKPTPTARPAKPPA